MNTVKLRVSDKIYDTKEDFKLFINNIEVGCVSLDHINDDTRKYVFVHTLEIYSKFRNKGYGKLMLRSIENYCKSKKTSMELYVEEDNIIAINMYNRYGFKYIKNLKEDYTVLVMEKQLN